MVIFDIDIFPTPVRTQLRTTAHLRYEHFRGPYLTKRLNRKHMIFDFHRDATMPDTFHEKSMSLIVAFYRRRKHKCL